ncbi:hypothetical protein [Atlantibacter hermannii]|uniref:hypothetical protein n=1 Tax=Atlantibacter hermannii TaxID=565 RepID=UPI0028A9A6EA|nr:hypothetical protein [Atlantibacter hermannii]
MGTNNKHLVRVGREFAAAMSDDTPIITIAKMVTELASALDVQSARSDALAAELARYSMPAGEADQRMAESRAVRQALGFGQDANDVAPIDLVERINALAAENTMLKAAHPQPFGPEMMKALDAYEKHQDEVPETGMLDAFFILRDSIRVTTPSTDAWVNEQRDAILDATFEAAKQEVERRFGRTFQDCAWLARRNSDTQMKGAVEMAEWVELYAAQLRGSQV